MSHRTGKCSSGGISPAMAVAVMVAVTVITAAIVAVYVYLYRPPVSTILAFAAILAVMGWSIIILEISRQNRKIEKMDKGRKILEIKRRGIDTMPESLKYAMILVCCCLGFGIVAGAATGDYSTLFMLTTVLIADLIILALPRKVEIYEEGIRDGARFVKWREIERVEMKDRVLEIKPERDFRKIMLRDEDGSLKSVVEKYVRGVKQSRTVNLCQ